MSRAIVLFNIVYTDMWGPYKIPIVCKNYYFLNIMDEYSRFEWDNYYNWNMRLLLLSKPFF